MNDDISHPYHYNQDDIECIDVITQLGHLESFCVGNAIKYLWRYRDKNGMEDLRKARWYLDRYIQHNETIKAEFNHEI